MDRWPDRPSVDIVGSGRRGDLANPGALRISGRQTPESPEKRHGSPAGRRAPAAACRVLDRKVLSALRESTPSALAPRVGPEVKATSPR